MMYVSVREQNLAPQNVSLACRLFQAGEKKNLGPKVSGKNFDLAPNCLKILGKGLIPQ